MFRVSSLLPFLVGLAVAQEIYLQNFADLDESGIPRRCRLAYNTPLDGCRARDFFPGSTCSAACLRGIASLQADIQLTCGGVPVPVNTLLGQAILGNLPAVLCPNNDLDDPHGTTTATTMMTETTATTSDTATSTFTTESSSTTLTTPTSISTTLTTVTSLEPSSSPSSSSSRETSISLPPLSLTSSRTDTPSPTPTETLPEPEDDDEPEEEPERPRPNPGGDILNLVPVQDAAGMAQKPYVAGAVIASLFSIGTVMFLGY